MENQMLERTESGVALAWIGGLSRTAHVQDEARVRQIVGDVDNALQFVHGFDSADAFDLADGERSAALAHGAHVAAGRSVQGNELQAVRFERASYGTDFRRHSVFEVAARAENLH